MLIALLYMCVCVLKYIYQIFYIKQTYINIHFQTNKPTIMTTTLKSFLKSDDSSWGEYDAIVDKTNRFLWVHKYHSGIFVRKNIKFNDTPLVEDVDKNKYDNYFANNNNNNNDKDKNNYIIQFEKILINDDDDDDDDDDDTENYINNIFTKKYASYLLNNLRKLQKVSTSSPTIYCYAKFCLLDEIYNVCNVVYINLPQSILVMIKDKKLFFVFFDSLKYLCLNLNNKYFDFDVGDKKEEIDIPQIVDSVIDRLGAKKEETDMPQIVKSVFDVLFKKSIFEINYEGDDDDDDKDDNNYLNIIPFKPNKEIEIQISKDWDIKEYINWTHGTIFEHIYVRNLINFDCDLWNIYKIKKNLDNEENVIEMERDESLFINNLCRNSNIYANAYFCSTVLSYLYNVISIDFKMKHFLCMDKIYNSQHNCYLSLFKIFQFNGKLVLQYTTLVDQIYSISHNDVMEFMIYIAK